MARTRAPWTSQNAPRMHLQSQRALLAEMTWTWHRGGHSGTQRDRAQELRVRSHGSARYGRTNSVGALFRGCRRGVFRASAATSSRIFDGGSNRQAVWQLRLAAHVHTRLSRGLPTGSAVRASRKDGLQAQAPERPGPVLITGGKILLHAGARCAQPPALPSAAPFSGLSPPPASPPCAGDAEQRDGAILPAVGAVHYTGGADVLRAGHADDVHERARRRPAQALARRHRPRLALVGRRDVCSGKFVPAEPGVGAQGSGSGSG